MRTVAAVFPSQAEATETAHDLRALGISDDEIIVAAAGHCLNEAHPERKMAAAAASGAGWLLAGLIPEIVSKHSAAEGAFPGAFAGAAFGLIAGIVAYVTPSPALAPFKGLMLIACLGLLGAAAGAIVAYVYGLGVSHECDAFCAESIREHGTVVAAHVADPMEPDAMRVMTEHGASKLRDDADPWIASGWAGAHPAEELYPSDSEFVSNNKSY